MPNPISVFTFGTGRWLFVIPSVSQQGEREAGGGGAASVGSQFWEPSFTFGGQKLLKAVMFLV